MHRINHVIDARMGWRACVWVCKSKSENLHPLTARCSIATLASWSSSNASKIVLQCSVDVVVTLDPIGAGDGVF